MSIPARLLGPEGETWADEIPVKDPPPLLLDMPLPNPRVFVRVEPETVDTGLTMRRATFDLERVLGEADGGPLAIYRCRSAWYS